jgi:8-oxo-dGTP pyrophosphatase MutT (NUDIX family)
VEEKIGAWTKLSSKTVYKNKWFSVRQDKVIRPDGSDGEYNIVVSPPAVFIIAQNENKYIYLVGQMRYTTGQYSIELPAGSTDNKDPLESAKKELQEETGLTAKNWQKIGEFYSANGLLNELSHLYLATDLTQTNQNKQLDEGIDKLYKLSEAEIKEMVKAGEIKDAQTLASFAIFFNL